MVPKSNKKPITENKEVEKQSISKVSQPEVEKEEKSIKRTTLRFDVSKLAFQFYDPLKALPENLHADIPDIKKVFFVPLGIMFKYNEENYKNILSTGNSYVYSRYEEVTLVPTNEIDAVKDFINFVMEQGRHAVIILDDPNINETNKNLAIDLVKRSLYKFRIAYSDIINTYNGDELYFCNEGSCSYVTIIPVHAGEKTYNFVGYSVDINLSNSI